MSTFNTPSMPILFPMFINIVLHIMLQLIGVPEKAEKDEIVKSVLTLKKADIDEGYTMDVVVSRQVDKLSIIFCNLFFNQIF